MVGKKEGTQARTLASQGGLTLFGQVSGRLLGFVFIASVTRLVTPGTFGTYTLALTILLFLLRFSDLNLERAIDYFVPPKLDSGDRDGVRSIIANVLGISLLSTSLLMVLLIGASPWIVDVFQQPQLRSALLVLVVALPFMTVNSILTATFRSMMSFRYYVLTENVVRPLVKLIVTLGMLLIIQSQLLALLGGYLIAVIVAVGVGMYLLVKNARWLLTRRIVSVERRELISYTLPLMLAGFGFALSTHIDYYLIAYFRDSADVGVYRAVFYLVTNLTLVGTVLNFVLKPMIAGRESDDELADLYKLATRWALILLTPPTIVLITAPSEYLSAFFTQQYIPGDAALVVLCLGTFVSYILGPGGITIEALGYSRLRLINSIVLILVNTALGVLFIPEFGIFGAALGTVMAFLSMSILALVELYYLRGITPFSDGTTRALLAAVLPGSTAYLIIVSGVSGVSLLIGLPLAVVFTHLLGLRLLKAFEPEDKALAIELDNRLGYELFTRVIS